MRRNRLAQASVDLQLPAVPAAPVHQELSFQPVLLGTAVSFEDSECVGLITDETLCDIYIESECFSGWMSKALFWELSGSE